MAEDGGSEANGEGDEGGKHKKGTRIAVKDIPNFHGLFLLHSSMQTAVWREREVRSLSMTLASSCRTTSHTALLLWLHPLHHHLDHCRHSGSQRQHEEEVKPQRGANSSLFTLLSPTLALKFSPSFRHDPFPPSLSIPLCSIGASHVPLSLCPWPFIPTQPSIPHSLLSTVLALPHSRPSFPCNTGRFTRLPRRRRGPLLRVRDAGLQRGVRKVRGVRRGARPHPGVSVPRASRMPDGDVGLDEGTRSRHKEKRREERPELSITREQARRQKKDDALLLVSSSRGVCMVYVVV